MVTPSPVAFCQAGITLASAPGVPPVCPVFCKCHWSANNGSLGVPVYAASSELELSSLTSEIFSSLGKGFSFV